MNVYNIHSFYILGISIELYETGLVLSKLNSNKLSPPNSAQNKIYIIFSNLVYNLFWILVPNSDMPLQSIKLVLKEFYAQYEFDEV